MFCKTLALMDAIKYIKIDNNKKKIINTYWYNWYNKKVFRGQINVRNVGLNI